MIQAVIDEKRIQFPENATLQEAAAKTGHEDALLAVTDNEIIELGEKIPAGASLKFLTYKDKQGFQAYQRSALLMLMKAFYAVVKDVDSLSVDFAFGDGLFIRAKGDFVLDEELLEKISERMKSYADKKYPIRKHIIPVKDAVKLFESYGMNEKARLFHYRRAGTGVNVYSLGHFEDYFYGYMVPNASYIKTFALQLYDDGFLLRLPRQSHPDVIEPFSDDTLKKLYQTLKESVEWSEKLNCSCAAALNDAIVANQADEMILISEALQEKKISRIAEEIAKDPKKKLILIAGPSSSGKTSFANRLSIQLKTLGLHPHPISTDDYFKDRDKTPLHPDGTHNFECLGALDLEAFTKDMSDLLAGKTVQMPEFNFVKGIRELSGNYLTLEEDGILVIEGIFGLNDKLTENLPEDSKFRIYVSALGQINLDEHNYIPSTDGRLIRRIIRDHRTRGISAQNTIASWKSVRQGEEENIFPYQNNADVMFNTSTIYELAVMKKYAEALLFQIPEDAPEYLEAKRLLRFLDYFLAIDNDLIPHNSLVREFIGGSCFKV